MLFGHFWLILGLLLIALIVFGPKRMIEMGSQLGKTLRETRDAMKDMNWSLTGDDTDKPPAPPAAGADNEYSRVVESAPSKDTPPTGEA